MTPSQELLDSTENWFVRIGIPHFIDDYRASEDVWTRAVEWLTLIFFAELFLTFGDNLTGWSQAGAFVLGLGVIFGAIIVVNRLRGRRALARPEDIGVGELALFVLVPPVLALLGGHDSSLGFLGVVVLNLFVLLMVYVVVAWGIIPMARWGLQVMWRQISQVVQTLGRILPLMLLFSAFLFLNAEIWQVVNDFTVPLFLVVLASLVVIGIAFHIGAMKGAIRELRYFDTWSQVARELDDTPMEGFDPSDFDGAPRRVPIGRPAELNLTLRLVVGLGAQVLLVTLLIFGFYLLFGVLTVREDTVLQWTTLEPSTIGDVVWGRLTLGGEELIFTRLHVIAAGFVAAFSGLQFAVSLVTDEDFKRDFVEGSNAEVREALAVRAVYLRMGRILEAEESAAA